MYLILRNSTHRVWICGVHIGNAHSKSLILEDSDLKISVNERRCPRVSGDKHPHFGEGSLCWVTCSVRFHSDQERACWICSERLCQCNLPCLGIDGEHHKGVGLSCDVIL